MGSERIGGKRGRAATPAGGNAATAQLRTLNKPEAAAVGKRRLSQGDVMGFSHPIADSDGNIGAPYLALSTLAVMERNGTITREQRRAGERFHELFRLAALDGLKAADMGRVPSLASPSSAGVSGNEVAKRKIAAAIRVLGGQRSLSTSCAWHVLGLEWSRREWAVKALRGNAHEATGVVRATLAVLEAHFGD